MSGIYIPGMEKSKACAFCRFCEGLADTPSGSCAFCVVDGKTRVADTPPNDCPLISVPPHGRLIDADAMCDGLELYNPVVIYAECMPTIIPASREGEG